MVWPTIQLHGCQVHDYVVGITRVPSVTCHSVVTHHCRYVLLMILYEVITVYFLCFSLAASGLQLYVGRDGSTMLGSRQSGQQIGGVFEQVIIEPT